MNNGNPTEDNSKAENEKIWNTLKPSLEILASQTTAFYEAVGSNRTCRQLNELWRPEKAIGIGYVPPEAQDTLVALIASAGISLQRINGPLGKGMYFNFLHNENLTPARLEALAASVARETETVKGAPPPPPPAADPLRDLDLGGDVARVEAMPLTKAITEGKAKAAGERSAIPVRTRPAEVAAFVDAFNVATAEMPLPQALGLLADAIPHLNLPEITRRELLRTVEMMRTAES